MSDLLASSSSVLSSIEHSRRIARSGWPTLVSKRTAMFGSHYQLPIATKDELQLPLAEDDPRRYKPIKPMLDSEVIYSFKDPLVNKFINMVMMNGEKFRARNLVYGAFEEIKRIQLKRYYEATTDAEQQAIECDPHKIFHSAIKNCTPALKLTPVTRGGITYQVPCFVRDKEAQFIALKWMVRTSRDKNGKIPFEVSLANELLNAHHNEGRVVKKKQDLHRQCETNRAYAHYRWS